MDFNTITLTLLQIQLTQLSVPSSIGQRITSFLTERQQLVRIGKFTSKSCTINLAPPRAMSSPHCSSPSKPMTAHLLTLGCFLRGGIYIWISHIAYMNFTIVVFMEGESAQLLLQVFLAADVTRKHFKGETYRNVC